MPLRAVISNVPHRWIVCTLCSWALAIVEFKATCFYRIALMVYFVSEEKVIPPPGDCPFLFFYGTTAKPKLLFSTPVIYWKSDISRIWNSASYIGMLLTVVPAGVLSDIGYSKYVLGGGVLLVTTGHLLLPLMEEFGVTVLVMQNIFEGMGEASIYSSIMSLISLWAPHSARNAFTAFTMAGLFYGGTLAHVFFDIVFSTWSFGSYTIGAMGLVWFALWFVFIYHSKYESPFLSRHEFGTSIQRRSLMIGICKLQRIPWTKILTSRAFLSLVLVLYSLDWAVSLNIWTTYVYYQENILHLPDKFSEISTIILISALPSMLMGGFLADWMNKQKLISKVVVKRTFVFISVFFSSILHLVSSLVGCNVILFWVLSITAVYTSGLAVSVIYSALVDLCPRHAGLLMGIMTAAKTLCSFFIFRILEKLNQWLPDRYNPYHWRAKLLVGTVLALVMMIPFLFYGSGATQRWRCSSLGATQSVRRPPVELEPFKEPDPLQSPLPR